MKKLFHPKWLLIVSAAPLIIYLIIAIRSYQLSFGNEINSKHNNFYLFIGSILFYVVSIVIYSIITWYKKRDVHPSVLLAAFCIPTVVYCILGFDYSSGLFDQIVVLGVDITTNFFQASLFVPGAVFYIVLTTIHFNTSKTGDAWKSITYVVSVPVLIYLGSLVEQSKTMRQFLHIPEYLLELILIGSAIFIAYHIIKCIYIYYNLNKQKVYYKDKNYILLFGLFLPIIGLVVNSFDSSNVFGNFSSIWFFALAVVNGALLLIPEIQHIYFRTLVYLLRVILFSFTVYFCIVFLPYTPISIILVIAFGVGILMLTPILLFFIHFNILKSDFNFLRNYIRPIILVPITIIAFCLIPYLVHLELHKNLKTVQAAITLVDAPDYEDDFDIEPNRVKKVFNKHRHTRGNIISGNKSVPIISNYFKTFVLENKSISLSRGATLKSILTHSAPPIFINEAPENIPGQGIELVHHNVTSTYDSVQQYWTSTVELHLLSPQFINSNSGDRLDEYFTSFDLPVGCYVTDYHLLINDTLEQGILAEQKAATWTYDRIVNTNKDPGFLKYISGDRLSLRVFPFLEKELRKTNITFVHKEPTKLVIDDITMLLGDFIDYQPNAFTYSTGQINYLSETQKKLLDTTKRLPYYHFIVDGSEDADSENFAEIIDSFVQQHPEGKNGAMVSFVNYCDTTFLYDATLSDRLEKQKQEAGFNLNWAIEKAIYNHYQLNNNTYPLFIVCTNQFQLAYIQTDFSDMQFMYPDADYFYSITPGSELKQHNLFDFPEKAVSTKFDSIPTKTVFAYPNADRPEYYLSDIPGGDIIFDAQHFELSTFPSTANSWEMGLILHAANRYYQIYPKVGNQNWGNSVYQSFTAHIMTPATAFLALENEEQKKMLLKKQTEILAGTPAENLGQVPQMMSEPNLWWFVIPFIVIAWWKRKRLVI